MILHRLVLAIALAFVSLNAFAQGYLVQGGAVTAGHAARWVAPGVVGDAGAANGSTTQGGGYLSEIGITNTGTPLGINDALISAGGGYHSLTLGANALGGGLINYQANAGAQSLPLQICANGTCQTFPFGSSTSSGCIENVAAGGTGDAITIPALPCAQKQTLLLLTITATNATVSPTITPTTGIPQVILSVDGAPLHIGDLMPGFHATIMSDGTNWFLLNLSAGASTSVEDFGAKCDGTTDDAAAIQATITANPTGIVAFPAGSCRFNSTLTVTAGNISLAGQGSGTSTLLCRTGGSDCLDIVAPGGIYSATRINNISLMGFTIDGTGNTAGFDLGIAAAHDVHMQDLTLNLGANGLSLTNTNIINWNWGNIVNPTGSYALRYDTDPGSGVRSDGLWLSNVLIGCNFSGADGIVQDGASYSLAIYGGAVLNCAHDFHVMNSRSFVGLDILNDQWTACAGDGASANAVRLSAGAILQIAGCTFDNAPGRAGQGSADGPVVQIDADTGFTPAQSYLFSNNSIASGSKQCLLDNGINNTYTGNTFGNCGGTSTYAVMEFGGTSSGISACGNFIGDIYSTYKYTVQMDYPAPRPSFCINGNSILQGGGNPSWLGPFGFVGYPSYTPPTPPYSGTVANGGAQMQIGQGETDTSGTMAITFPAPFGSGPTINITPQGGAAGSCGSPRVNNLTATGSQITGFSLSFLNAGFNCGFAWSAVGF